MKTILPFLFFALFYFNPKYSAQEDISTENYGNTLNAGFGMGYFGYDGYNTPVLHLNYEFQVAKNLTIAPFISFYRYHRSYYWGNHNYPYKYYNYDETVIPIGAKVTYYFDDLLHASSKWDFYLAGSLGYTIRRYVWDSDYYGETRVRSGNGYLYIDLHIGAEYHFNNKLGMFADLSSGMSTIGLAFHL
jgi:hypothetical protein